MSSAKWGFSCDNTTVFILFVGFCEIVKTVLAIVRERKAMHEPKDVYVFVLVCVCALCYGVWTVGLLQAAGSTETWRHWLNHPHLDEISGCLKMDHSISLIALVCVCFCLISWRQTCVQPTVFVLKWPSASANSAYLYHVLGSLLVSVMSIARSWLGPFYYVLNRSDVN